MPSVECMHFAENLNWKMGAVVLSPGDVVDSQSQIRFYQSTNSENSAENDETPELSGGNMKLPQLAGSISSAGDVLNMKLNARLVVLFITSSGVANLAGIWLRAAAVLISVWTV